MEIKCVWGALSLKGPAPLSQLSLQPTLNAISVIYWEKLMVSSMNHNNFQSSVKIVTRYGVDDPKTGSRFLHGYRLHYPSMSRRLFLTRTATFPTLTAGSFTGVKSGRIVSLTTHQNLLPKLSTCETTHLFSHHIRSFVLR